MAKNLVSGLILAHLAQIRAANFYLFIFFFFSKIWLRQSLDLMLSYHHVQYQEKLMIQSWENLVTDERTDGRTDGQRDESNFIGRCPTNVERPIWRVVIKVGLLHLYSQKHRNTHEC